MAALGAVPPDSERELSQSLPPVAASVCGFVCVDAEVGHSVVATESNSGQLLVRPSPFQDVNGRVARGDVQKLVEHVTAQNCHIDDRRRIVNRIMPCDNKTSLGHTNTWNSLHNLTGRRRRGKLGAWAEWTAILRLWRYLSRG